MFKGPRVSPSGKGGRESANVYLYQLTRKLKRKGNQSPAFPVRSSELLRGGDEESLHDIHWPKGELKRRWGPGELPVQPWTEVLTEGHTQAPLFPSSPGRPWCLSIPRYPQNFSRLSNQFLPCLGNSKATKWTASSSCK